MKEADKLRVLEVIRHKSAGLASLHRQSALLREVARLVPDFAMFRALCIESMSSAWKDDRLNKRLTTQSVRRSWERLFRHFARQKHIDDAMTIKAINRAGLYECTLTPRQERGNDWKLMLRLGKQYGILPGEFEYLVRKAERRKYATKNRIEKLSLRK